PLDPATHKELMSYCKPGRWPSDYTYTALRNYLQQGSLATTGQLRLNEHTTGVTGSFLAMFGSIDLTTEQVTLPYIMRQAEVSELPPLIPGPYHIRLYGTEDQLLADYPFTPVANDDDPPVALIHQVIPFVSDTQRIEMFSDRTQHVLANIGISAHA